MQPEVPKNGAPQTRQTSKFRGLKSFLLGSRIRQLATVMVIVLIAVASYFTFGKSSGSYNPPVSSTVSNQASYPDCGTTKELLQNSPVKLSALSTIIPMGNIAPPGHIGPTPHMYYNYISTRSGTDLIPAKTNIYSPADITVTKIALFDNASSLKPFNSYRIDYTVCQQVTGYFIHMVTLGGKLAAAMKPPYDSVQTSHISGVKDEHVYNKVVNIKLSAGELMGTGGGGAGKPDGLDFGLVDTRTAVPTEANPARWKYDSHYVCSLDYYPADLSKQLYAHIGDYNGNYLNPGNPKCGTVYQDLPGTAQGVWFTPDQPKDTIGDPSHEITLAHSNLNHSLGVFALGNIVDKLGVETDQPLTFKPGTLTNVDFSKVKPNGKVYCYQIGNKSDFTKPDNVILVEMLDAYSLRLGSLSTGSCGSGPWQMSPHYIDYVR